MPPHWQLELHIGILEGHKQSITPSVPTLIPHKVTEHSHPLPVGGEQMGWPSRDLKATVRFTCDLSHSPT